MNNNKKTYLKNMYLNYIKKNGVKTDALNFIESVIIDRTPETINKILFN
jgi:hypothetical protein